MDNGERRAGFTPPSQLSSPTTLIGHPTLKATHIFFYMNHGHPTLMAIHTHANYMQMVRRARTDYLAGKFNSVETGTGHKTKDKFRPHVRSGPRPSFEEVERQLGLWVDEQRVTSIPPPSHPPSHPSFPSHTIPPLPPTPPSPPPLHPPTLPPPNTVRH